MRELIVVFENSFRSLSTRTAELLELTAEADLYRRPRELPQTFAMFTIGEYILRSAAAVEQTFGGITTRLWDDPFEWTLPEKLSTVELVKQHIEEVDKTRAAGFEFLATDESLSKQIPAPVEIKPLSQILIETLARAEHFQGRAFAIFQMLSDKKPPGR